MKTLLMQQFQNGPKGLKICYVPISFEVNDYNKLVNDILFDEKTGHFDNMEIITEEGVLNVSSRVLKIITCKSK